jgi:hypothetical protein
MILCSQVGCFKFNGDPVRAASVLDVHQSLECCLRVGTHVSSGTQLLTMDFLPAFLLHALFLSLLLQLLHHHYYIASINSLTAVLLTTLASALPMPFYLSLIHKLSNKHSDLACQNQPRNYEENTQGLERNATVGSEYRMKHKGKELILPLLLLVSLESTFLNVYLHFISSPLPACLFFTLIPPSLFLPDCDVLILP